MIFNDIGRNKNHEKESSDDEFEGKISDKIEKLKEEIKKIKDDLNTNENHLPCYGKAFVI